MLRKRSSVIHAKQELMRYGLRVDASQVTIAWREKKRMVLWPKNEYAEEDSFIIPLASYVSQAAEYQIDLDYPVGGYWNSMDAFCAASGKPEHFVSLDPTGLHERREGEYLIGFSRGHYGKMGDLPERMAMYARENSLRMEGAVYVLYLHDEICERDSEQYLAQACVAVNRIKS
jgi:hypothetical protein